MIVYKYPHQAGEDFIDDIQAIDEAVFEPAAQGTKSSLLARYKANRESYILAYDGLRLVGYIGFFPISGDLSGRILAEDRPYDDNIQPWDILDYTIGTGFDMFLISMALLPAYAGMGIGKELMRRYFDFMTNKIESGCNINNMYAYAFTAAGEKILLKSGFEGIKDVQQPGAAATVKLMVKAMER